MRLVLVLLSLVLVACPTKPVREPSPDIDQCEAACFVLIEKCPNTKLSRDKPCNQACRQVETSGYITINPGCIAKAETANAVRACNIDCKE